MSDVRTGKISATLSVWSDRLLPSAIAAVLELQPDRPAGACMVRGWHVMCLENETQNASDVLSMLMTRLSPYASRLRALNDADPCLSVTVFLQLPPQPDPAPLFIRRDVLRAITSLGANLEIEFGCG